MSIDNTFAKIQNYQIFFYQERGTNAFKWRRIFVSEALDLPITAYISQVNNYILAYGIIFVNLIFMFLAHA